MNENGMYNVREWNVCWRTQPVFVERVALEHNLNSMSI